jgi:3-oxoacyl-[acyl-carrier protein] reductase
VREPHGSKRRKHRGSDQRDSRGWAKAYTVDVADHAAVQKIGAQILRDFSRADILINNAGITRDVLAMRMSLEDWDSVVNTNLRGAFSFSQSFVRAMIKQRNGRIINISSVIGLMGNAGRQIMRPAKLA